MKGMARGTGHRSDMLAVPGQVWNQQPAHREFRASRLSHLDFLRVNQCSAGRRRPDTTHEKLARIRLRPVVV